MGDVESFIALMSDDDALYKSSSLDFAHEHSTSDNTIDLAEQVNNHYFRTPGFGVGRG